MKARTPRESVITRAAFNRAMELLREAQQHLELTIHARILERRLEATESREHSLEVEDARLRRELNRRLPGFPACWRHAEPRRRAWQIVEQMLQYAEAHYQRPMGLVDVAASLGMNASYLSTLFAEETGITFHRFLSELRFAEAEKLLSDPHQRVGEVASAVGYASDDSFRHAFTAHTGLSPSAWRGSK